MQGSRSGALMATAWTTLMHNGDSGYRAYARAMGGVHARLKKEIAAIPGLRLMGNPDACVVAFTSDEFNIYVLADALSAKGWEVPRLQRPACIHFCVGGAALQKLKEDPTKTVVDKYLEDLKEAAATCMATRGEKGKVRVHACVCMLACAAGAFGTVRVTYGRLYLRRAGEGRHGWHLRHGRCPTGPNRCDGSAARVHGCVVYRGVVWHRLTGVAMSCANVEPALLLRPATKNK